MSATTDKNKTELPTDKAQTAGTPSPSRFRPAVRCTRSARVAIAGLSGTGRTLTALRIARALGDRIAVLDTDRGKAAQYAKEIPFDHHQLTDFDPEHRLLPALADAAQQRYPVLIVDCYSLFWIGPGGLLDRVDRDADGRTGNTSPGWRANRPMDRRVQAALLAYPGHLIVTLRSKTDYVIAPDHDGQPRVHRYALQPEQRAGLEYDFDLLLTLGEDHRAAVDKSSIDGLPAWTVIDQPGTATGEAIRMWAETGEPAPNGFDLLEQVQHPDVTVDDLRRAWSAASDAHLLDMAAVTVGPKQEVKTLAELIIHRQGETRRRAPAPPPEAPPPGPPTAAPPPRPRPKTKAAQATQPAPEAPPGSKDDALKALHAMVLDGWSDLATIEAVRIGAERQGLLDAVVPGLDGEDHILGTLLTERLAELTTTTTP